MEPAPRPLEGLPIVIKDFHDVKGETTTYGSRLHEHHRPGRSLVYAWVNNRRTLRASGSKTDPCPVFPKMLGRGYPPDNWAALVTACKQEWHAGK